MPVTLIETQGCAKVFEGVEIIHWLFVSHQLAGALSRQSRERVVELELVVHVSIREVSQLFECHFHGFVVGLLLGLGKDVVEFEDCLAQFAHSVFVVGKVVAHWTVQCTR